MNNDPRGSQWRKWDLHIHTPLSIKQNYGGDQEDVWEEFFEELENLPDEYSVLGINDYLFLDGYERVVEYKESGGLENIDLILPVLEFRVDRVAGTSSNLRRVNYHVIFSNQISTEKIKQQFISGLVTNYKLNPKYKDIDDEWSAVVTRDALGRYWCREKKRPDQ